MRLDVNAGAQQKPKPKKNWKILYKVSYREMKERESERIEICGDKQEALEGHQKGDIELQWKWKKQSN